MFETQKNESMNNVIAYVAPKNKTMAHIMSLNNMISCIVLISIFGFKTYWEQVFNLMDIKKNANLNRLLASRNTQRLEEKDILSTIRCQATESLPQEGNDQTASI